MSGAAPRRARLLRLRIIEHRLAAVRLATADSAHTAIVMVADRVARLRGGIVLNAGASCGCDLQSQSELSDRLDGARAGLERSLVQARDVREARHADRIVAHVAEHRTASVHAEALRRESTERDLRAAAARPPRLRKPGLGR